MNESPEFALGAFSFGVLQCYDGRALLLFGTSMPRRPANMIMVLMLAFLAGQADSVDSYAPLRLYDGAWSVTMHDDSGKSTTDSLVNDCHLFGRYFACQQTVNGKVGALVVYVPGEMPGHFYIQNVLPDDQAVGRGELTVEGSRYTYAGHDGSSTHWWRTTNEFTGKDRIHFEQAASTDGKTWTTTVSGDEIRGTKP
jgi:hypothetical protein